MNLAFLLLLATLFPAPPEAIVLLSGHRIAVEGEVREDGNRLVFKTAGGKLYSVPISEIDVEASLAPEEKKEPTPAPAPTADARPLPRRQIKVTDEEKRRLLDELAKNRSGQPAPEQRALTREGLEEELERADRKRESDEASAERWRARARERREALQRGRDRLAALQEQERRLQDQILQLSSMGYSGDQMSAQILQLEQTRGMIDRAREAISAAERAWAQLEEDARRAGALPGWLRE